MKSNPKDIRKNFIKIRLSDNEIEKLYTLDKILKINDLNRSDLFRSLIEFEDYTTLLYVLELKKND